MTATFKFSLKIYYVAFFFSLFICGGFFAYTNRALQRSPRGRARRAPIITRRKIHLCGLFTQKFGMNFKGSTSASSGQARLPAFGGGFGLVKSRFEQRKNQNDFSSKENAKNLKEQKLKWGNRWTQLGISSNCPIAPLKKRFRKN